MAQNKEEAVKWYRKSAEQGYADAQYNLAELLLWEGGDGEEAFKWYQKAAKQGHAGAQDSLGLCYEEGPGAQNSLSFLYDELEFEREIEIDMYLGMVDEKDSAKAAEWYRKAAEQGLGLAQYHLGRCYEGGHGVTKDLTKAAEWYQKAADQGHEGAKKALKKLQGCDVGTAVAAGIAAAGVGILWKILNI